MSDSDHYGDACEDYYNHMDDYYSGFGFQEETPKRPSNFIDGFIAKHSTNIDPNQTELDFSNKNENVRRTNIMDSTLQIRSLEIEGFGNISHIVMKELKDRIILEGTNGVGKSTILNAVIAALEGVKALPGSSERSLSEWIKSGHESAVIKLELANGKTVQFTIRVVITPNDYDVTIKEIGEDGKAKKITSPMAFLKSIVNTIAFRPQAWRKKSDAEQCEEIFKFFPGLKEKLDGNTKKLSDAEKERADLLAKAKVLRLDIERVPFTPNLPEKEVDPKELLGKLTKAQEHNKGLVQLKDDLKSADSEIKQINDSETLIKNEIQRKEEMIRQMQEQVEQSKKELNKKEGRKLLLNSNKELLNKKISDFKEEPIEPINKEISELNEKNKQIRDNLKRKTLQDDLEKAELDAQLKYKSIKSINEERSQIMSSAEIPIDGLSIGENCLLYPNSNMEMVRLSALSDGEFWTVACGLVAAFNPKVKILIIDQLHELDRKNFELLDASAKKYGMQTWIEKTLWDEEEAGAGFLIRDGELISGPKAA